MIKRRLDGRLATTALAVIAMVAPGVASPAQEASDATAAQQVAPAPEAASSQPTDQVNATDGAAAGDEAALPATIAVETTQAQAPLPESGEPEGATRLDDVVVTSTKRASPVRKIAATVNVLSGENLEREGVQSIDQIVQQVPGVNLTDDGTGGSAKRITIRGISTGFGVNPTAGTLFGDIPFTDPFAPKVQLDPNPFDMATVEVLKGPQGTLFGGTGLNGLIRYVPEAPQLDGFRVKYYTQLQSYPGNGDSGWSYGAVVNAPFAENTAAVRVLAFHRDAPGYVDDTRRGGKPDVNSMSQYGLRGALTWLPAEHWKVSLMAAMQHTLEDDLSYTENYDGQLEHDTSPRSSPIEYSYTLGNLGIERSFDWGDLMSQTSYFGKKFDAWIEASRAVGGIAPLLGGADTNRSDGMTQELRAVSAPGDSPWRWLAGAFYYKTSLYDCANIGAGNNLPLQLPQIPGPLTGLLPNPCPGNVPLLDGQINIAELSGDIDLQEHALFGELTRSLGEDWEVTLGARAYRLQAVGAVTTAGAVYASQNNLMRVTRTNGVSERGISPKASIVFAPTQDLRSYFTVSRGFRFGGPQIGASIPGQEAPEVYKSDSLWNYELGLRTDWLDRTLRVDVSAYHIDWTNPQVFQQQKIGALPVGNFIDNVGSAQGNGVELSLRYLLPWIPGLSLDASGAWNETVTTAEFTSVSGELVPTGSPWPLSPRWQTASTVAYAQPIKDWQAGVSLRHMYMSKACNSIECTGKVFGYRQMDLNVFASGPEGSWWPQLSLSLNNITDERGIGNVTTNPAPASDTIVYIAPRALVLRLSGNF